MLRSVDEAESADPVEVERSGAELDPTNGVGEPAPGDLGLAGFDLGDFAFGSGSFAVAVPELRCRPGSTGSSEDLFVGVDLDHATLDSFRASVMQRTRRADRGREPDLGPFPIRPGRDGHRVAGRAGDRRRVQIDREVGFAEQSLR